MSFRPCYSNYFPFGLSPFMTSAIASSTLSPVGIPMAWLNRWPQTQTHLPQGLLQLLERFLRLLEFLSS
ncbi:MAG: hypothetical protein Ct9H300mP27_10000 [Chloroflexota bacterium]|nr:MAG: hypothetical protein Ct9H300mP27_10000 [Chloroflexota bacterium]